MIVKDYIMAVKVREEFKVSKEDFIDFVTSQRYCNIFRKAPKHKADIAAIKISKA